MKSQVSRVKIRKEAYKFSVAHMTVFPNGEKESLHGHNYTTEVNIDLRQVPLTQMVSFADLKTEIREVCQVWDEKVLLPKSCPYLEIKFDSEVELEFLLCGKRYVLPRDEVVLLEIDNITVENLAEVFCAELVQRLMKRPFQNSIVAVQVLIEESPGQGASFSWESRESAV